MRESRMHGSVRGALSNERPYRDRQAKICGGLITASGHVEHECLPSAERVKHYFGRREA